MAGYETPVEIASAFIENRPSRKRLSSFFKGTHEGYQALLSYGTHYPALVRGESGRYLVNATPSSVTTNRHVRAARISLRSAGYVQTALTTGENVGLAPHSWEIWTRG